MFFFLSLFWLVVIVAIASVALPILRMCGVIDWEWKIILAPIWVPLVSIFVIFLWVFVPIFSLAFLIFLGTP